MVIVYLLSSVAGALTAVALAANHGWIATAIAAPIGASLLTVIMAGRSFRNSPSSRPAAASSHVPHGVVWC